MKTKCRLSFATVYSVWYIVSCILLWTSGVQTPTEGVSAFFFDLLTHFFIPLEVYVFVEFAVIPLLYGIYTGLVLLKTEDFTKAQRIYFGVLPAVSWGAAVLLMIFGPLIGVV